ncbi:MAG TPA: phosphate signaling complex protein PhoU [Actinomycetota bacterium]
MRGTRRRFHEELDALEAEILAMGELAERAVARVLEGLVKSDDAIAAAVINDDDEVDEKYIRIEQGILELLALQTPVASDLRLITSMLHINLHLERIGDMAVNIAKTYRSVENLPGSPIILSHIREMGDVVRPMIRTAMEAFSRRDLDLCLRLPEMDDPVDRLNLGMYKEVAALASDEQLLNWGLRMILIARQLERVGDHAVDIGEQVGFLLTGEFREFTDASHPVHLTPDAG